MAPKHDERPSVPADYKVPDVWEEPSAMGGKFGGMNRPTAGPRFDQELQVGKHPLQLYSLGTPNGHKVTIMLEELGVEYDAWFINIMGDQPAQFGSGFTQANPNSKIPALMDHSEVSPPPILFSISSPHCCCFHDGHTRQPPPPVPPIAVRRSVDLFFFCATSSTYVYVCLCTCFFVIPSLPLT